MFSPNFASSPFLADIAAVTDNNRGNNNGFGDNNGWWILIIPSCSPSLAGAEADMGTGMAMASPILSTFPLAV